MEATLPRDLISVRCCATINARLYAESSVSTDQILVRFQDTDLDLENKYQRRGEYRETYKSSDPRRSPEGFVKHPRFHLIYVCRVLRWTKVGIVVPCDIIHLFDTKIVYRIEYDNPHYMVSRIACA